MTRFKYKNILVTGGAGFIGSHLTEKLLDLGCKVTVIDDLSEGTWKNLPKHKNLKKVKASITDKNIGKYFKGVDVVFHLAALPRVQRSIKFPIETHEVNTTGTLNLLLASRDNKIKRFIYSSSSSVYGEQKELPLTETMIPNPISPYGLQKLMAEKYCILLGSIWSLNVVVLRYFNVYGDRMNPDGAYANLLPKFIKLMKEREVPVINGDGNNRRDFTHVSDVVNANILAAKSKITGEIINVGSSKNFSVNEVTSLINKLLKTNIKPMHGPGVYEPTATLAGISKAKRMLGYYPKVKLTEGIKSLIKINATVR